MTWWHYLLLVNIYLLLFFGFYALLLRHETFFQLNRIYLVSAALLSFFIPVIQAQWVKDLFITQQVQYTIYSSTLNMKAFAPLKNAPATIGQLLLMLYITGAVILTTRLIWQLVLVKRFINQPAPAAYSFFKKVKLNNESPGNDMIARHEAVHVGQWHSADVLLIEAVMIINWFNPVVYLYRSAIKYIHEFIADRQALITGTDKAEYATLLLSQAFHTPVHYLTNSFFNHSLLKQRIMMIQKNRSHRIKLIKYGLSAPLFILMLALSSATINNSRTIKAINAKAEKVFLKPAASVIPGKQLQASSRPVSTDMAALADTNQKIAELFDKGIKEKSNTDTLPNKGQVFTAVEHPPQFPGGVQAFGKFLGSTIKYPAKAREAKLQGRVIVTFIVEADGSLSDIKVVRGLGNGFDEEALRALNISPKWEPGIQNGRPVRVQYSVPIQFALDGKNPNTKTGSLPEKKAFKLFGFTYPDTSSYIQEQLNLVTDGKGNNLSINSTNQPLYIVDGKEAAGIAHLDLNNIESISILKDNSAVALYGNRGLNGVVIVSTKKKAGN